jgi:DNA-binding FadR family transcriptional regulator
MSASPKKEENKSSLGRVTRTIVDAIGEAIVTGQYPPEELVPSEAELAAQHGSSRSVLREAIKVLNAKGLVTARPRRGTSVTEPSEWNLFDPDVLRWILRSDFSLSLLLEFTEVRLGFEPGAAELAAKRGSPAELAAIERSFDAMVAAGSDDDALLVADIAFHIAILDASGNRFYRRLKPLVTTALRFSIGLTNEVAKDYEGSAEAHRQLLQAICRHDARGSRRASERLLLDTRAVILKAPQPAQ